MKMQLRSDKSGQKNLMDGLHTQMYSTGLMSSLLFAHFPLCLRPSPHPQPHVLAEVHPINHITFDLFLD